MKKLRRINQTIEDFPEDIDRIISVANKNGYELSRIDAEWIWIQHSDSHAAGWLGLSGYSSESIMRVILSYMEEDV